MKIKKKRKGLKILAWIMGIILVLSIVAIILLFSFVSPSHLVSMMESNFEGAPKMLKAIAGDKEAIRDYSTMPSIMVMSDGTKIVNEKQYAHRKEEIISLFKENVYGTVPDKDYKVDFNILEQNDMALEGNAIRKQVEIKITTDIGSSSAIMLIYLPKTNEKVPVFIGLNFIGNTTIYNDSAIIPSYGRTEDEEEIEAKRGERYERWVVDEIVKRGYGIATICSDDFAPDNKEYYDSRLISIFGGDTEESEFKTINAWAFGLIKGVDYLVQDSDIDSSRIMTFGHSRLGKTSLWAAAQDDRVALAIANGSGSTGASLSRGNIGETVELINKLFPYWFVDKYSTYAKKENELPLDQHMLLAAIAPRKVYIASSNQDLWADPVGEYQSLRLATNAYELFGSEAILDNQLPKAPTAIHTQFFGYHIKEARHKISLVDWEYFMDYADEFIK